MNFYNMFNKKRFILLVKCQALLLILVIVLFLIPTTLSKYESNSKSKAKAEVAFYVVDVGMFTENVLIEKIEPRVEPYIYNFTVSNNNGDKRVETNLEYELSIRTTTNLPLEYSLYMNEQYNDESSVSIITSDETTLDEDGTYFRYIKTDKLYFSHLYNETNNYQLVVYFPSDYKDAKYQDIYELLEIKIDSKQIIDSSDV